MKYLNIMEQQEERCGTCYYFVHNKMCFRYPDPTDTSDNYACGEWRVRKIERTVGLNGNPLLGFSSKE